jgi:Fur family zinc uptake transcriptional regulator
MATHDNHKCCLTAEKAIASAELVCTNLGARFTAARKNVFSILWKSDKALGAKDIMKLLGNNQPPITYRALEFLLQHNLVHHLASINAYSACCHVGEDHVGALMVCQACHAVSEADYAPEALHSVADDNGFSVERTYVEMLGTCKQCLSV